MVSFHEFNDYLKATLNTELPTAILLIKHCGDYVADVIMSLELEGKSYDYKPYDLYLKGVANNEYELVVYEFIVEVRLYFYGG